MPPVAYYLTVAIDWAGTLAGLFAFIHAVSQRADAYTAADRKTKPIWLAITGAGTAAMGLFGFYGPGFIFWIAAIVACLVYIVDVRPKLIEVQKGGQSW